MLQRQFDGALHATTISYTVCGEAGCYWLYDMLMFELLTRISTTPQANIKHYTKRLPFSFTTVRIYRQWARRAAAIDLKIFAMNLTNKTSPSSLAGARLLECGKRATRAWCFDFLEFSIPSHHVMQPFWRWWFNSPLFVLNSQESSCSGEIYRTFYVCVAGIWYHVVDISSSHIITVLGASERKLL